MSAGVGHVARPRAGAHVLIAATLVLFGVAALSPLVLAQSPGSGAPLTASEAAAQILGDGYDQAQLLGYNATEVADLTDAAPVASTMPVTLGLTLIPRDPMALQAEALAVSTPGNPSYGKFLTASQFDASYAPTLNAYSSVLSTLASYGIVAVHTYSDRSFILASGPAASIERAFSTTLVEGQEEGRTMVLPATAPSLPTALAGTVLSVSGLEQEATTFSLANYAPTAGTSTPSAVATSTLLYPDYLHFLWNLDGLYNETGGPHWATSTTIGLLLWGDGFSPSDLSQFGQQMYPSNEPAFSYNAVPLDGAPAPSTNAPNDPSNAPLELTLDMEWSISQAPGALLVPVYVPDGPADNNYSPSDSDLEDGLSYLVNSATVDVISMSFGAPEGGDPSFQTGTDQLLEDAATMGISAFASSGDNGGCVLGSDRTCANPNSPQTEYPAASPWVVAVGGTQPIIDLSLGGGPTGQEAGDAGWSGSGGGYSTTYLAPTWQDVGSAYTLIESQGHGQRGIPDISGPAANNTLIYNGSLQHGEGTSFASPAWAGLVAEMDAVKAGRFGFLDPKLYALGAAQDSSGLPATFRDVTVGESGSTMCSLEWDCAVGWDPATGWGEPENAVQLYAQLQNAFVNITISFNPSVGTPGSDLTLNLDCINTTSAPVSVPINITIYSDPADLSSRSVEGTLTVVTGSNGHASGTYAIPSLYAFAHLLVQAQVFSRGAVGSATALVVVSPLGGDWGVLYPLTQGDLGYVFFALIMSLATALGWFLGRGPPALVGVPHPPWYRNIPFVRRSGPRPVPAARHSTSATGASAGSVPPRSPATPASSTTAATAAKPSPPSSRPPTPTSAARPAVPSTPSPAGGATKTTSSSSTGGAGPSPSSNSASTSARSSSNGGTTSASRALLESRLAAKSTTNAVAAAPAVIPLAAGASSSSKVKDTGASAETEPTVPSPPSPHPQEGSEETVSPTWPALSERPDSVGPTSATSVQTDEPPTTPEVHVEASAMPPAEAPATDLGPEVGAPFVAAGEVLPSSSGEASSGEAVSPTSEPAPEAPPPSETIPAGEVPSSAPSVPEAVPSPNVEAPVEEAVGVPAVAEVPLPTAEEVAVPETAAPEAAPAPEPSPAPEAPPASPEPPAAPSIPEPQPDDSTKKSGVKRGTLGMPKKARRPGSRPTPEPVMVPPPPVSAAPVPRPVRAPAPATPPPAPIPCWSCGRPLPPGVKVCPFCKTSLT